MGKLEIVTPDHNLETREISVLTHDGQSHFFEATTWDVDQYGLHIYLAEERDVTDSDGNVSKQVMPVAKVATYAHGSWQKIRQPHKREWIPPSYRSVKVAEPEFVEA